MELLSAINYRWRTIVQRLIKRINLICMNINLKWSQKAQTVFCICGLKHGVVVAVVVIVQRPKLQLVCNRLQ